MMLKTLCNRFCDINIIPKALDLVQSRYYLYICYNLLINYSLITNYTLFI